MVAKKVLLRAVGMVVSWVAHWVDAKVEMRGVRTDA